MSATDTARATGKSHTTDTAPYLQATHLFAGAWSSCYAAAVGQVASERNISLPADLSVDIEVDLNQASVDDLLQARLTLRVPGLAHDVATELALIADAICPYSKATRGNIGLALNVLTA